MLPKSRKAVRYPPGHGDFYQAFADSGLLDNFLAQGRLIL